jgi:hypothetical protein
MFNLLQYDLKNTTKKLLGYIISLILFAVIVRFLWSDRFLQFFDDGSEFYISYIIQFVSIGVLICLAALMVMVMMVRQTQWFDENLLSAQGQLTNMLPVATWQLVLSKIIAAFIWSIAMLFILIAIGAVFFVHTDRLGDVIAVINDLGREAESPFTFAQLFVGLCVFGVISMCAIVTQCFLSLIIGQLFSSMRNVMIFFSFIIIAVVVIFCEYMIIMTFSEQSFTSLKTMGDILRFCQGVSYKVAAMNFVVTFIYWGLAAKLLKRNLNLL